MLIMDERKIRSAVKSPSGEKVRPLEEIRAGQWVKIISLPVGVLYAQFIRLGFHEGQRVKCLERLPGGTVVLQKNRQQVAVGHLLAKSIYVVSESDHR